MRTRVPIVISRIDRFFPRSLSAAERAAYEAPFPSSRYTAAARAFPALVPTHPDDPAAPANRRAWEVLSRWQKPFVTAFSDGDPITRGGDRYLQKRIPGAQGMPHVTLRGGHFLQEDSPHEFAAVVLKAVARELTALSDQLSDQGVVHETQPAVAPVPRARSSPARASRPTRPAAPSRPTSVPPPTS